MAPSSGRPRYSTQSYWTRKRPWSLPPSAVSGKVLWPWNMAWCKTNETLWGGKVQPNPFYQWATEEEYLILKLKGEKDV